MELGELQAALSRFEDGRATYEEREDALSRLPVSGDVLDSVMQAMLRVFEGPPYPSLVRGGRTHSDCLHLRMLEKWLQAPARQTELDRRVARLVGSPKLEVEVRLALLTRLADLQLPRDEQVGLLAGLVESSMQHYRVRQEAAHALARLAPDAPEAFACLKKMREKRGVLPALRHQLDLLFKLPTIAAMDRAPSPPTRAAPKD